MSVFPPFAGITTKATPADKPDDTSVVDLGTIDLDNLVKLLRAPQKGEKGFYRRRRSEAADAVEALRESVADLESRYKLYKHIAKSVRGALDGEHTQRDILKIFDEQVDRAEAAEARVAELAGALEAVQEDLQIASETWVDSDAGPTTVAGQPRPPDNLDISLETQLLVRAALAATPTEALERTKAKDAFIDLSKILLTRGHLGLAPPTSGWGRKTIADWRKARANLDALDKEKKKDA